MGATRNLPHDKSNPCCHCQSQQSQSIATRFLKKKRRSNKKHAIRIISMKGIIILVLIAAVLVGPLIVILIREIFVDSEHELDLGLKLDEIRSVSTTGSTGSTGRTKISATNGYTNTNNNKNNSNNAEDMNVYCNDANVNVNRNRNGNDNDNDASTKATSKSKTKATRFLSQANAKQILKAYVEEQTSKNMRPRFVPSVNSLMANVAAAGTDASTNAGTNAKENDAHHVLTFQLGGMDGKTGDPFFKMTSFHNELSQWVPIVVEPVPKNFELLKETYRNHASKKQLQCYHVLHRMINYNENGNEDNERTICDFCIFDHDSPLEECQSMPEYIKSETGSMDCQSEMKRKCFKKKQFTCDTILNTITNHGYSIQDLAVLQLDVEGYEKVLLEGFFAEVPSEYLPPVINFESRILKRRGELGELFQLLREKGYGIHEKRMDTLAILGAQGLLLDNL